MKILLDEHLPHALRAMLSPHECFTVAWLGWKGTSNGRLLALAGGEGFDALITCDRGYEFQHNLNALPCSVIVLHADSNSIDDIKPLVPSILVTLESMTPKSLVTID